MPLRKATAIWNGTLAEGDGTFKTQTGLIEGKYTFGTRFKEDKGTNPEELIGAAHAGCYSMAFSGNLVRAGFNPKKIKTEDHVHLEKIGDGFTITKIEVNTEAEVPDIDEDKFQEIAETTKKTCPVSRALAGVEITVNAKLKVMA